MLINICYLIESIMLSDNIIYLYYVIESIMLLCYYDLLGLPRSLRMYKQTIYLRYFG